MRSFLILVVIAVTSFAYGVTCAQGKTSQWAKLSNDAYVLKPAGSVSTYLLVNLDTSTHQVAAHILRPGNCQQGGADDLGSVGTYKVNGTFVKFHGYCLNGNELDNPDSDEGKSFFAKAIETGSDMTIDTGDGNSLHFQTFGYYEVKSKLVSTDSAL